MTLTLSAPDPALIAGLAQASGAIGSTASLTSEDAALEPIGSGPYVLALDETVARPTYVLDGNDENWDAANYPYETM